MLKTLTQVAVIGVLSGTILVASELFGIYSMGVEVGVAVTGTHFVLILGSVVVLLTAKTLHRISRTS